MRESIPFARRCALSFAFAGLALSAVAAPKPPALTERLKITDVKTVTVQQIMAIKNQGLPGLHDMEGQKRFEEFDTSHMKQNPRSTKGTASPLNEGTNPMLGGLSDPPLVLGTNFMGIDLNQELSLSGTGATPPDTMAAVGPDQVLVYVNGRIRVYDKAGNLGALDATTDSFWTPTGVISGTTTTDPRVVFDPVSGRWILIMITENTPDQVLVAFSSGPHITNASSFTMIHFRQDFSQTNGDTGNFADYPTLGVDANAVYIGCNMFKSSYYSSTAFVIPKTGLFASSPTVTAFRDIVNESTFTGPYTPQGVFNPVSTAQGKGYFIGVDAAFFGLVDVLPILNPGTTPTLGSLTQITIPTDDNAINVTPLGSSSAIDADDWRLMGANICQDPIGTNYILCAHHMATDNTGNPAGSSTQDSVQWFQIRLSDLSLTQAATLFSPAGNSLLYPSVSMSETGDILMGFTEMGPSLRPECVIVRQVPGDSAGSFPMSVVSANSGTNNFNLQSGVQRWGDYSFTCLDPKDGMTMWTVQEFDDASQFSGINGSWACQVSQIKPPPPPPLSGVNPSLVAHGYSGPVDVTGTPSALGQVFFEPSDDLAAYRNNISIRFGGLDMLGGLLPAVQTGTDLHMTMDGAETNTGSYPIMVTNPDGQTASGTTLNIVPALNGFTTDANTYSSGATVTATLSLEATTAVNEPISLVANSGGGAINLTSPQIIPAGSSSLQFTMSTNAVAASTPVQITASDPGNVHSLQVNFTVNPTNLSGFTITPTTEIGGHHASGTVTLSSNATGNVTVHLTGGDSLISYPSTVTINSGTNSATFSISDSFVSANDTETLTASVGGSSLNASITLTPYPLASLTFNPNTVIGLKSANAVIKLKGNAGPTPETVTLSGGDSFIHYPATATIPAGATGVQVKVTTSAVSSNDVETITATFNGSSVNGTLTITPAGVKSLTFSPGSQTGGYSATGIVTLNGHAGPSGDVVTLSGGDSFISYPSTVTVAAGQTVGKFKILTFPVNSNDPEALTATLGPSSANGTFTVTPAIVQSVTFNPNPVTSGSPSTGTITLHGKTGSAGATVSLSGGDSSVSYPATVTFLAGQTSKTFTVTTSVVAVVTNETITATLGSSSASGTLTLNPPSAVVLLLKHELPLYAGSAGNALALIAGEWADVRRRA